ncbi:MAG: hypothetical protein GY913_11060 [Proteobacteria bacterium]|nr:hypothetical protein [Pseudomonadota bacterium]MCP4917453.1 hypothetical protein [Pseudomonadota bacterium]
MECLTPLALSGALTMAPPQVHPSASLDGKATYGTPQSDYITTDNFVIVHGTASTSKAQRAGEALEAAWTALIEEQGWTPPVSSDNYLVWVIFDTGMSGTGLTTEYESNDFPQGYPVIYLNPAYANDADFWTHLAAHEFAHTLQYAARDEWTWSAEEAWFWEASGEWMVEQALPDVDVYAWQVSWYSRYPWYRYDSLDNQHQYGMGVFVGYLDEFVWGDTGLRDLWNASGDGTAWIDLLGDVGPLDELWPDFAAKVGNEGLRESGIYEPVLVDGVLKDGSGEVAFLGTDFYEASGRGSVSVTGSVELSGPLGTGTEINVEEGDVVGVTGFDEDAATYTLTLGDWIEPVDTVDTGPEDIGAPRPFDREGPRMCACSSVSRGGWIVGPWLLALALLRRRE